MSNIQLFYQKGENKNWEQITTNTKIVKGRNKKMRVDFHKPINPTNNQLTAKVVTPNGKKTYTPNPKHQGEDYIV